MEANSIQPTVRAGLRAVAPMVAIVTTVVLVGVYVPHLRALLFQLPYFSVSIAISGWFAYQRAARPERVPPVLAPEAPLALKLARIKRALVWTGGLGFCATIASGAFVCACDANSTLAILSFAFPLTIAALALVGYTGVDRYLKERTAALGTTSTGWPGPRRSPAEFKPFHSEHWGERVVSNEASG